MEDIIVYGAGGHGKTVIDMIEEQGLYRIVGVLDDHEDGADELLGYPVIRNGEKIDHIIRQVYGGVVAIAENHTRSRIVSKIEAISPEFDFVNIINPVVSISRHAKLGQGIVIMFGVRIGADATIGGHCVICSNSTIAHDSDIGDYVFVGTQVGCSGSVAIGAHSYVLSGSVIINNTTVGHHTVVGSASNVLNDLPSNVVAYGNPAQVVRTREAAGESLFRKRVSLKDVKGNTAGA